MTERASHARHRRDTDYVGMKAIDSSTCIDGSTKLRWRQSSSAIIHILKQCNISCFPINGGLWIPVAHLALDQTADKSSICAHFVLSLSHPQSTNYNGQAMDYIENNPLAE